jgi:hypothetical protein
MQSTAVEYGREGAADDVFVVYNESFGLGTVHGVPLKIRVAAMVIPAMQQALA